MAGNVAHCWQYNCNKNPIIRVTSNIYGDNCSICGHDLSTHPFFGIGMEFDKGDPEKWQVWTHMMSDKEKAETYVKYGFPVPRRLVPAM